MSREELDRLRAQLEEARREAAELDAQVRLLVRTEHRLTRAQAEADRQVARVRALSTFALAFDASDRPIEIACRATDLLREWFAVDHVGVMVPTGRGAGLLVDGAVVEASAEMWDSCEQRGSPFVCAISELAWARDLIARVESRPPAEGVVACIPLHRGDVLGLMCWRHPNPLASFFSEAPNERHLPFLTLLAKHLSHALDNATLTHDLRQRTEELSQKNSELQQSLKSVREADERLAQAAKLEAIGRLAGGIAHDFNNLLMVILTNAELLRQNLPPVGIAHEDLGEIVTAAERARDITRQLLAYSRKRALKPEEIRLDSVVDEFARLAVRLLGERVELRITHVRRGGTVRMDRAQLDQVLLNLATNARDAMGGSGVLSIETRAATEHERAQLPGDVPSAISLVLADTGMGMDEATRERIFEPFFSTKDLKGTGLGLAIVHTVVSGAGGVVQVESSPGSGTRFTVVLPECEPVKHDTQPAEAIGTVLLVEDEVSVRQGLQRVLSRAGYRVFQARDGHEALSVLRANPVDVVLTDVMMPGMTGPELARVLETKHPDTPILFMTGHAFDSLSSMDLGSHQLLTKPFPPAQLLDAVRLALTSTPLHEPH